MGMIWATPERSTEIPKEVHLLSTLLGNETVTRLIRIYRFHVALPVHLRTLVARSLELGFLANLPSPLLHLNQLGGAGLSFAGNPPQSSGTNRFAPLGKHRIHFQHPGQRHAPLVVGKHRIHFQPDPTRTRPKRPPLRAFRKSNSCSESPGMALGKNPNVGSIPQTPRPVFFLLSRGLFVFLGLVWLVGWFVLRLFQPGRSHCTSH